MATPTNMGSGNMQMVPDGKTPPVAKSTDGARKGDIHSAGIHDGKALLNARAPGKLGHNRSTSLRPRKK